MPLVIDYRDMKMLVQTAERTLARAKAIERLKPLLDTLPFDVHLHILWDSILHNEKAEVLRLELRGRFTDLDDAKPLLDQLQTLFHIEGFPEPLEQIRDGRGWSEFRFDCFLDGEEWTVRLEVPALPKGCQVVREANGRKWTRQYLPPNYRIRCQR